MSALVQMRTSMENVLVNGLFQCLAGLELRCIPGRNLNGFAGSRVATGGRFAMRNAKGSEADKPNFTAALHGGRDGIKDAINSFGGISF